MTTRSIDSVSRAIARTARAALLTLTLSTAAHAAEPVRVTELLTQPLANVAGKEVTMITVDYAPGAADPIHRHNASAFVYVLEGVVEMQMKGGEKVTLRPGQTFYEDPDGIHLVGRNASDKEPAKFVVFLVKNPGTPIFIPVAP